MCNFKDEWYVCRLPLISGIFSQFPIFRHWRDDPHTLKLLCCGACRGRLSAVSSSSCSRNQFGIIGALWHWCLCCSKEPSKIRTLWSLRDERSQQQYSGRPRYLNDAENMSTHHQQLPQLLIQAGWIHAFMLLTPNTDFSIQNVTTDIEAQTRHKLLNFLIQFLWACENWSLGFLLLADRSEPVWFSVSVVHLLWFVRSPADLVCDKCLFKNISL